MGRSLGFASTPTDYGALLRLAFASAAYLKYLTLPVKVTRRFIMQKARCHTTEVLQPLVSERVQGLFHSPPGVLFTPIPNSSASFSTMVGSDLHYVLPQLHPDQA